MLYFVPFCTINSSTGVKGREATASPFSLVTMAPLPKWPFQDPRPLIYTLVVVARHRMPPAFSCFAPQFLNRADFCIISSHFEHYDHITCIQIAPAVILCKSSSEYNTNITAFVHIVLCLESMDRTAHGQN